MKAYIPASILSATLYVLSDQYFCKSGLRNTQYKNGRYCNEVFKLKLKIRWTVSKNPISIEKADTFYVLNLNKY